MASKNHLNFSKILVSLMFVVGILSLGFSLPSLATSDPAPAPASNPASSSTMTEEDCATGICKEAVKAGKAGENGIVFLLKEAIKILSSLIVILAIGGVVWCGVQYASAGDNTSQVAEAKERLKQIIIGIILYALLFALLNFLIPGGVFGSSSSSQSNNSPTTNPSGQTTINPGGTGR